VEGAPPGVTVLAGRQAQARKLNVLVSNFRLPAGEMVVELQNLPWNTETTWEWRVVSGTSNLEREAQGRLAGGENRISVRLHSPGVGLLQLQGR
jgi:hypothetical protein